MDKKSKVFVAGHETMAGAAILRRAKAAGFKTIVPSQSDLTDQKFVFDLFDTEKPGYVFIASAKVGGILANSRFPADFIYSNIQTQTNVIHAAWKAGVKKLLYLGSSCMYPKESPQPMKEEYLMTGKLEPTSEPYAVSKIAGFRMCQSYKKQYGVNFITAVPADMYGPMDDFNPETGHVLAALMAKMHLAKTTHQSGVTVWGTGAPRRDCLYVDDMADACVFLMEKGIGDGIYNIGAGTDVTIRELAETIKDVVGFGGRLDFDASKPDGTPRKLLDVSRLAELGWTARYTLKEGIQRTYEWYRGRTKDQDQDLGLRI